MTLRSPSDEPLDSLPIPTFEVLPDGSIREIPLGLPAGSALAAARAMPDGRMLALASRDLMPGVQRPDGPFVEGVAFPLIVLGMDGAVVSDVDIRVVGEHVRLVAATATEAVLLRTDPLRGKPTRLVGRDLATGAERPLWTTGLDVTAGDATRDRVVVARLDAQGGCRLEAAAVNISVPACQHVTDLDIAPDGRFAAVVYQRSGHENALRLRILDLGTGEVYGDEALKPQDPCVSCVVTAHGAGYLGMAWSDGTTLRVAQLDPLPLRFDPARVLTDIAERVHLTTRAVPG
ncbi:hypothetical protein EV193_110178 [Herbihabitans rhizosphaerae]|uniref:Uncharacterized protein n=2 Tax=Herbihabitans rhizosphaerae TaxID=1872711 RepID=A0A4Q7KGP4_9PSEU|nr:hypothetical protein EV193_110178 [Herbihabitans rhizosphaerae]